MSYLQSVSVLFFLLLLDTIVLADYENTWNSYFEQPCCNSIGPHYYRHHKGKELMMKKRSKVKKNNIETIYRKWILYDCLWAWLFFFFKFGFLNFSTYQNTKHRTEYKNEKNKDDKEEEEEGERWIRIIWWEVYEVVLLLLVWSSSSSLIPNQN